MSTHTENSPPTRAGARIALSAIVALGLLAACGKDQPPPPALVEIPVPALEVMEPQVREQLARSMAALAQVQQDHSTSPARLAQAFGETAELYHAYELYDAGAAAYKNAATLAPDEFRWPYLLANLEQARGNVDAAEAGFKRAQALRPRELLVLVRLGRLLLDRGRATEAKPMLERALDLDPTCAAAHFALGKAAADAGDFTAAVSHYQRVLELQPDASIARYPKAQAHRALGDEASATRELAQNGNNRVALADPYLARLQEITAGAGAALARAGTASRQGRIGEAIEEYQTAVAANPESATARRDLAFALAEAGRLDEAIPALEAALAADPKSPLVHNALGAVLGQKGDLAAALQHFDTAVEADPRFKDALFNRASAQLGLGKPAEAEASARQLLAVDPQQARAHSLLASALAAQGNLAGARTALEQALAITPGEHALRYDLAQVALHLGDRAAARRHYQELANTAPASPARGRVHLALANLLREERDMDGATRHYETAIADDPELAEARFNLASSFGVAGRYADALPHFSRLVLASPGNELYRLGEATSLAFLGRWPELRRQLEAGVAAIPGSAALGQLLARLLASAPDPALRDPARAIAIAREAFTALPGAASAETLAMAEAAAGSPDAAARRQRETIARMGERLDPASRARLEANLARYEAGEICCAGDGTGQAAVEALFGGLYGG